MAKAIHTYMHTSQTKQTYTCQCNRHRSCSQGTGITAQFTRHSDLRKRDVGLLCIYMKSLELCGRAFALAGTEPRGRFHTHVRSEMFADFKLSSYDNYLIFPFADLERMTR